MAFVKLASGSVDPPISTRTEWYRDPEKIAELLTWLYARGELDGVDTRDIIYIVLKPWKWTAEYEAMIAERNAHVAADPPSDERITIDEDRPEFQEDCE